jgi:hypothetical protein
MDSSRAQSCGLVLHLPHRGQRTAPVIGLTFIDAMKRNGLACKDGSILDPRTGSACSAWMDRSPDGLRLSVRSFSAFGPAGRLAAHAEAAARRRRGSLAQRRCEASCGLRSRFGEEWGERRGIRRSCGLQAGSFTATWSPSLAYGVRSVGVANKKHRAR